MNKAKLWKLADHTSQLLIVAGFIIILLTLTAPAYSFPGDEYGVEVVQDEIEFFLVDYNTTIRFALPYSLMFNYTDVYGDKIYINYMYSHPNPLDSLTLAIAYGNLTVLDIGDKYVKVRIDSNMGYAIFNISVPQWGTPVYIVDDLRGGKFQKVSTFSEVLSKPKSWYYDESKGWAVLNVPTGSPAVITIKWYEKVTPPVGGGPVTIPKPELPKPVLPPSVERAVDAIWSALMEAYSLLYDLYYRLVSAFGRLVGTRAGAIAVGVALVVAGIIGLILARERLE